MSALVTWLVAAMMAFAPPSSARKFPGWTETEAEARARYQAIAEAIEAAALDASGTGLSDKSEAALLLDELAQIDLQVVGWPPSIAGLQALSAARQSNALRHWLRTEHGVAPSQAQLEALLSQIRACTTRGHQIELKVGAGMVQRQRQHLQYTAPL